MGGEGGGGTRYITDPVTASSWLSPGSHSAAVLRGSASTFRTERSGARGVKEERRRVPGPREALLPVKMHLLILSLETCVLIPSQGPWKETTLHLSALAHLLFSNRLELMMRQRQTAATR